MPGRRQRSLRGRKPGSSLRAEAAAPPALNGLERARIESAPAGPMGRMPLEVTRQAQREMDRLRRLPPGSPEAGHIRSYLQWLWSMPWERTINEDADLKRVESVLERDHLALPKAKERVIEYLAVRRLKPDLPGPALCLVGPPGTSAQFVDHYLGLPCDLSHAVLILCANMIDMIPDPLLERIEVIEVPGYSEDEKLEIARRYLIPRQLHDHGLSQRDLTLPDESLRAMTRHYTLEAGVRGLSRQIATVCRKVARARATGDALRHQVTADKLERYLGHRIFSPETAGKNDEVGVASGLAWTAAGGEVLVVEALKMPGAGRVVTTGQLGEVMKESVQAAHSYVHSRAEMLEIDPEAFSNYDIHIHFPAAGVPKDGPSAGITVGLVIASVLSARPIRHDVAMTGEVSLRGRVLVVGGLREKALASYRAGFRAMLFPAASVKDIDDIPEDVRAALELVPVS